MTGVLREEIRTQIHREGRQHEDREKTAMHKPQTELPKRRTLLTLVVNFQIPET